MAALLLDWRDLKEALSRRRTIPAAELGWKQKAVRANPRRPRAWRINAKQLSDKLLPSQHV